MGHTCMHVLATHALTPLPASVGQNRSRHREERGGQSSAARVRSQFSCLHKGAGIIVKRIIIISVCQALAAAGGPSGHRGARTLESNQTSTRSHASNKLTLMRTRRRAPGLSLSRQRAKETLLENVPYWNKSHIQVCILFKPVWRIHCSLSVRHPQGDRPVSKKKIFWHAGGGNTVHG